MTFVAGFTSTGSKAPRQLFGHAVAGMPERMVRSAGCRLWDDQGREYLDLIMSLGAVGLGYAHPEVTAAATAAVHRGGIGSLAPVLEEELASHLVRLIPNVEQVRFLKSGAEAVAAAVRLARAATGRDAVLTCGYHGWLDWCSNGPGVPAAVQQQRAVIPFNNAAATAELIRAHGKSLACVVVEPVVEGPPSAEWLATLRTETNAVGALLIFDEIKTAFRLHLGGAAARWGGDPDLTVIGKALASGFPLAAVGGRERFMRSVGQTWISSTMATEFVSLAAALATVQVAEREDLPHQLAQRGRRLLTGLERLAQSHPELELKAVGIPEMCYLHAGEEETMAAVARGCASRGLLFKRNAYNFVSLAHQESDIDEALTIIEAVLNDLLIPREER